MFDNEIVMAIAVGIGVYFVLKVISVPIRILWKVLWNALLGWVALFLINSLAPWTGFEVPVTFWVALGVGIFGLPGLVALVIYTQFFM
jgi:SigmaK-factor processing regulatory protein BofA.